MMGKLHEGEHLLTCHRCGYQVVSRMPTRCRCRTLLVPPRVAEISARLAGIEGELTTRRGVTLGVL